MGLRISPSVVCIESKKPIETIATGAASVVVVIIVVTVVVAYAHARARWPKHEQNVRFVTNKTTPRSRPPRERATPSPVARRSVACGPKLAPSTPERKSGLEEKSTKCGIWRTSASVSLLPFLPFPFAFHPLKRARFFPQRTIYATVSTRLGPVEFCFFAMPLSAAFGQLPEREAKFLRRCRPRPGYAMPCHLAVINRLANPNRQSQQPQPLV